MPVQGGEQPGLAFASQADVTDEQLGGPGAVPFEQGAAHLHGQRPAVNGPQAEAQAADRLAPEEDPEQLGCHPGPVRNEHRVVERGAGTAGTAAKVGEVAVVGLEDSAVAVDQDQVIGDGLVEEPVALFAQQLFPGASPDLLLEAAGLTVQFPCGLALRQAQAEFPLPRPMVCPALDGGDEHEADQKKQVAGQLQQLRGRKKIEADNGPQVAAHQGETADQGLGPGQRGNGGKDGDGGDQGHIGGRGDGVRVEHEPEDHRAGAQGTATADQPPPLLAPVQPVEDQEQGADGDRGQPPGQGKGRRSGGEDDVGDGEQSHQGHVGTQDGGEALVEQLPGFLLEGGEGVHAGGFRCGCRRTAGRRGRP